MKTTAFARSWELARMASKIGLRELQSGNLQSRLEQAKILAEGLGKMKGAAMKAGQLLSLDLMDYFPKEAIEILSRLQHQSPSVEFEIIEQVLKDELGASVFSNLKHLDPSPVGSASIGQVHRATYQDRDLVLKVQYPNVAESIESDLKILKTVAKAFCGVTGREMDLEPLFREFNLILRQETDYTQEAQYQNLYGQKAHQLLNIDDLFYRVPKIESDLSTKKIIAMEWKSGETLRHWIRSDKSKERRERLAHGILNLYFHEFFNWGLVQTDPNQGNFLISEKSDGMELILLDFGATRTYERKFIHNYVKLLKATSNQDKKKIKDQAIAFGLIDPRESAEGFEALYQLLTVAVRPFFSKNFDFSHESHIQNSHETSKALVSTLKYSPPPHELIFLHRKLGGVYAALKTLGVTLDISRYWEKMMELTNEDK